MGGMAEYEVGEGEARFTARYFIRPCDATNLTADEIEVRDVVRKGFLRDGMAGRVGLMIDPFKAAEEILAEHYGHARMTEANYEWKPGIIH